MVYSRKPMNWVYSVLYRSLSSSLVRAGSLNVSGLQMVFWVEERQGHGVRLHQYGSKDVGEIVNRHMTVISILFFSCFRAADGGGDP